MTARHEQPPAGEPAPDAHLQQALRHAPDDTPPVPPWLTARIVDAARAAAPRRRPPRRAWWHRVWTAIRPGDQPTGRPAATPGLGYAGVLATVLIAGGLMWSWPGEPPGPGPDSRALREGPREAQAPAAPTAPAPTPAPAPTAPRPAPAATPLNAEPAAPAAPAAPAVRKPATAAAPAPALETATTTAPQPAAAMAPAPGPAPASEAVPPPAPPRAFATSPLQAPAPPPPASPPPAAMAGHAERADRADRAERTDRAAQDAAATAAMPATAPAAPGLMAPHSSALRTRAHHPLPADPLQVLIDGSASEPLREWLRAVRQALEGPWQDEAGPGPATGATPATAAPGRPPSHQPATLATPRAWAGLARAQLDLAGPAGPLRLELTEDRLRLCDGAAPASASDLAPAPACRQAPLAPGAAGALAARLATLPR